MPKKIVVYILLIVCFAFASFAKADEYGKVYLDLKEDEEEEFVPLEEGGVLEFWYMAQDYIRDVKEYDDLLEGKTINKDFSDDFKIKYKNFNDTKSEEWERYVRNGVKTYRFYKEAKQKIIDWIMGQNLPVVVDDDQYETGEKEEYIKSDEPLIIHDFKKVVSYSGQERDVLAAKEKYAEKHNLTKPSEFITRYKKALMEKNWKELFSSYIEEFKGNLYKLPKMISSGKLNRVKSAVLPRYQYADEDGNVQGVILVELLQNNVLLFSSYKDYKNIEVNIGKSENIKDWKVGFVRPQPIELKDGENILVYSAKFPIYFEAKIIDRTKSAVIKPEISASVCFEDKCEKVVLDPVLKINPDEDNKVEETIYSSYITSTKMNIPSDDNKEKYEIGDLVWEKKNDGTLGCLRLDVDTSDKTSFNIFIIGDELKYFAAPRHSLNDNGLTIRFDLRDITFNPLDKEISFWISTGKGKQYIHKQKVTDMSLFDINVGKMSVAVLWFAFLGGMLLNLMPCVFPVLFLKLLSYTKSGKLDLKNIRHNFILNIVGILTSFVLMALALAGLKFFGQAIGWGMQFQNTYFLVTVLWGVIFFVFYVFGLLDFKTPDMSKKIEKLGKGKMLEFWSGVFLVVLSTPCMAPYLGTAFGIALAGNIATIITTVMVVGIGLSMPYILVAVYPKLAFYFPRPSKWMRLINFCMIILLIVTIVWLISILTAQTNLAQVWHWILYIFIMFCILYFWKTIKEEINKIKDKDEALNVYKKIRIIFYPIVFVFIGLTFVDVGQATQSRKEYVEENYVKNLDLDYIRNLVDDGKRVMVKVGADWCLTCKYNDFTTFDIEFIKDEFENKKVHVINIDWTKYNPQVLKFMQKFGRSGLPFYVLFSRKYPDGVVLPEITDAYDILMLVEQ